ncbi:MAG TPA: hypothetical protein DDW30_06435, partial [Clostridiales bacterium]|nr:hypothetical protein [Clostridiales bacterium]
MEGAAEIITSRQNRTVVGVGKLTDRRAREASGCFRFDGIKLAAEAVRNGLSVLLMLLRESNAEAVAARLAQDTGRSIFACAERVLTLSDGVFDKISE